jgi:hypothetical protein
VAPRFVDEDQALRVYPPDFLDEARPPLVDRVAVALRGDERLFFRVYPRRRTARLIVDRLTFF